MKRWNVISVFCVIVSFVVLAITTKPLFHPGLFPTIDNISVVRLEAMAHELRGKQFPVRYIGELGRGHGYALFGYYAPLPFYSGAFLNLAGINLVGALKRSYLLAIALGCVGIFGLSYELFGGLAAATSVIAYVLSPFLGYDVYWRGGVGEVWAMGCMTWVLWFIYRTVRYAKRRDILLAACSVAGLILSHNLTAYMGLGFAALWTLFWVYTYKKGLGAAAGAVFLGMGLAAFFWVPAFMTRGMVWVSYLQADRLQVIDGLLHGSLKEIFIPTFIPMIINWTVIILPFAGWWCVWKNGPSKTAKKAVHISGSLFVTALFFMTALSKPVWDIFFPVLYIFQFPWRFLTMVTVFGSLVTGGLMYLFPKRRFLLLLAILGVFFYANSANFRPLSYEFIDKYRPQDPCGTSWGFEYFPVWVKTCLKTPWEHPYRITSGDVDVRVVEHRTGHIVLRAVAKRTSVVQLDQYAYLGWQVFIDNRSVAVVHENDNGLIEVVVPEGVHDVRVVLEHTPIERVSNMVSVGAVILLVILSAQGVFLMVYKRRN